MKIKTNIVKLLAVLAILGSLVAIAAVPAAALNAGPCPASAGNPQVVWSASSAYPGQSITGQGSGFTQLASITVTIGGVTLTPATAVIVQNGSPQYPGTPGTWTGSFTIPDMPAGNYLTANINGLVATDTALSACADFTVTPKVTSSPTVAGVGTTVTLTGRGFTYPGTATAKLYLSDGVTDAGVLITTPFPISINSNGSLSATFSMPEPLVKDPAGNYTIKVTDSAGKASSVNILLTPSIQLIPSSGLVGQIVIIHASDYPFPRVLTAKFDNMPVTTFPATVTVPSSGDVYFAINVPTTTAGLHVISVLGDGMNPVSQSFTVQPRIAIVFPACGSPGTTRTVSGNGFAANVQVQFDLEESPGVGIFGVGWTQTDSYGSFVGSFIVPSGLTPGPYTLSAVDGAGNYATSAFTVNPVGTYVLVVGYLGDDSSHVTEPGEGTFVYPAGTAVNLVATPDYGSQFISWVGPVADRYAATTYIVMNYDAAVYAAFTYYAPPCTPSPGGGGCPGGGGGYPAGRSLTMKVDGCGNVTPGVGTRIIVTSLVGISATPCDGWHFAGWTGDVADMNSPTTTVAMNSNEVVTARFAVDAPTPALMLQVPSFNQGDSRWENDTMGTPDCTLSSCGCAVTSTAMVLNYYGVSAADVTYNDYFVNDTNPKDLNQWLKQNSGYSGDSILWASVEAYSNAEEKGIDFVESEMASWPGGTDIAGVSLIRDEIVAGHPVIVKVLALWNGNWVDHWVVVKGIKNGTYYINDPGWPNSRTTLSSYNNTIYAMRVYHGMVPSQTAAVGSNVSVSLPGAVLTFNTVTASGDIAVTTSTGNPAGGIPSGITVESPFVDINTTAVYAGAVSIGIYYEDSDVTNESSLKLFHWNGNLWEDVTSLIDTVDDVVYGQVSSLSWFAIMQPITSVSGVTREVNGDILPGVSVTLDGIGPVVSDQDGQYEIMATATGNYTVTAHKDGFRNRTQIINITGLGPEFAVTCNFQGNYGLIPNAPDMWYALNCVNLWLYPPNPDTGLDMWTALDVINAWLYPVQ